MNVKGLTLFFSDNFLKMSVWSVAPEQVLQEAVTRPRSGVRDAQGGFLGCVCAELRKHYVPGIS